jgi:hypothetical protein
MRGAKDNERRMGKGISKASMGGNSQMERRDEDPKKSTSDIESSQMRMMGEG